MRREALAVRPEKIPYFSEVCVFSTQRHLPCIGLFHRSPGQSDSVFFPETLIISLVVIHDTVVAEFIFSKIIRVFSQPPPAKRLLRTLVYLSKAYANVSTPPPVTSCLHHRR